MEDTFATKRQGDSPMQHITQRPAIDSGTLTIGGDLTVSRLGFGTMRLTGPGIWGPPADRQEALAVLHHALDLGVNLLDTADSYGPEVAESLIAEALYPYPKDLVIATKGGLLRTGPNQWPQDGRPEHLRNALEGSLRRLRLDRIDIYQFHRPDPKVPFEDSVGELAKLRQEGKIRHVGLSNVTLDQLARSGGVLDQIARRHNAQPGQIALAWLLKRSSTMLPIPGTSRVKHLDEDMVGATIRLSQEEFDALDRGSK